MGARIAAGDTIDGYTLEQPLHRGGMAALWRVSRPGDPTPLLMKMPVLRDQGDPTAIVGFEVEQMVMPKLEGVHVPKYHGAGGFESQPYIVMELIGGRSLLERFDAAPLPPAEVADIGGRVATALHALHRQHVIHLDVKPSNIMFRPTGEAVLIDFGLAHHDHLPDLLAEEFRLPMGTAPYISPEQVLRIRNDPRSDLFSLGVLLYHLVTGQRPFGNPSTVAGLKKRLYTPPVPPRVHAPDCPPWLQEVILRCLEPDPARRYASAAQVAFDLTHPDGVNLTRHAERDRAPGMGVKLRRWWRSVGAEPAQRSVQQQLASAAIVVAAVDLSQEWEDLAAALRDNVRRVLQTDPDARLACVTVLKINRIGMDEHTDEEGRNLHVKQLVALKHWARPLQLPADRVTYHVLKSPDPADAIVDYARTNRVDHILLGSRGIRSLRRVLGSVSAKVVAQAACTVTVVKPPLDDEDEPAVAPPA